MVFIAGLVGIIIFYAAILGIGLWAGMKFKGDSEVETMNAGRRLGYVVGTLTLVGTWVGGGYINGTAERMYSHGLIHVQVPVGYSLALLVGALLFIKKLRDKDYITLLDPFQEKFGRKYGSTFFIPALASEFFWVAAVLNSLGYTLEVVLGLGSSISVIMSAVFAGLYTLVGGLNSVTYTDVAQLGFIVFGLVLSAPFALSNKYIDTSRIQYTTDWLGVIDPTEVGIYIENMLLLIFGGIPWQGYCQRVFSIRTTDMAVKMSWYSMAGTMLMALPAIAIGLSGIMTDWKNTEYGKDIPEKETSMLLPLVLRYLVPPVVAFFGIGAISGAVMSSADSAILASSALITRNIYKNLFRPEAADKELHWVLRIVIVIVTALTTLIAVTWRNVYYLSLMCSDLVYVILFPQLLLTLYCPNIVNTYGSCVSYIFALILRVLGGEPGLGIPVILKFPWYDEEKQMQRFPFKTAIVVLSAGLFLLVSYITDILFLQKEFNHRYDIFGVYKEKCLNEKLGELPSKEHSNEETMNKGPTE